MTSVDVGNGVSEDVFKVESARGTRKPAGAAALNKGMLAASAKFDPGRYARIPFQFESVRCREDTQGPAIKPADEDLFAGFKVYPLGVSLVVTTFVYQQPSRPPVITKPG